MNEPIGKFNHGIDSALFECLEKLWKIGMDGESEADVTRELFFIHNIYNFSVLIFFLKYKL
jgi:hypothetical protein